jgi:hypothetical protein
MKKYVPLFAALAVSFVGSALVPALKADERNKKTDITIDQPIDIQGTVLAPGSYVIKVLDSSLDRYVVQILNADNNNLITTIFAIPAYRLVPTDNTQFEFYEAADGQPPALHTWFYSGDNIGFEFRNFRGESARGAQ